MRKYDRKIGGFVMKCPYCGYSESRVIDSRPAEEGANNPPPRVPILPEEIYNI